jgi:hypothetical protein
MDTGSRITRGLLALLTVSLSGSFLFSSFELSEFSLVDYLTFQSSLPGGSGGSVPRSWVSSEQGGARQFGAVMVKLPAGFTNQDGANVDCAVLVDPLFVKDQRLVPGSQIALGIWPPNEQVNFEKPIEIWVTLDVVWAGADRLVVKMYDPVAARWVELPSEFRAGTSQIVAYVRSFKLLPQGFPWEKRALLGVFQSSPTPTSTATSSSPRMTETPVPTPKRTSTEAVTLTPTPDATRTPIPHPTYTPVPAPTSGFPSCPCASAAIVLIVLLPLAVIRRTVGS